MALPEGAHRSEGKAVLGIQRRDLGEIKQDFLEKVTAEQILEVSSISA